MFQKNELVLIRHADADHGGRLCGRTDIGLTARADADLKRAAGYMPAFETIYSSPAKRCVLTTQGLFGATPDVQDARLWEQDFGDWEGCAFDALPDLGEMELDALSQMTPPGGESYVTMVQRAEPALRAIAGEVLEAGPIAVAAHAGIVRVALSMVLDAPTAGLAFQVAPLSFTRLACLPGRRFAVTAVGWTAL